ncbi:MAG: hypothetical protein A3E38_00410 [Candidatus Moranbacteria bacterium RIFCSPHIGHO2_12_FULL_54_9]|nr:MAG: hypothetical protein A2878_02275 [Candidatus Moranbacteria bacterium RIFCSPHIGHO2_01_FULL_54_31]OGI24932.1 MAG: hypothetical protein A3E38_00410 [Candidatus Moranbacteria bacterium RIFCSPHIGHO2_12_FULL_54_9]
MLSKEEVKNIALLARIGIKDKEIDRYRKDLSAILDFFCELESVATDDVEPIGHITGTTGAARADVTVAFGDAGVRDILKNVPELKNGFIKVKSVF